MKKLKSEGRKIITISLPGRLYDDFIAICTKQNLNRSAIVSSYIERFIRREKPTSAKSKTV